MIQNPLSARTCRFESGRWYHLKLPRLYGPFLCPNEIPKPSLSFSYYNPKKHFHPYIPRSSPSFRLRNTTATPRKLSIERPITLAYNVHTPLLENRTYNFHLLKFDYLNCIFERYCNHQSSLSEHTTTRWILISRCNRYWRND